MLELTPNSFVSRDKSGRVKHIEQILDPFLSPSLEELTPEQLADQYLQQVAPIYQMDESMLADLSANAPGASSPAKTILHRDHVKETAGSIIVNYLQTYEGIPVWRADFSVHIASDPMRVTSSYSALHDSINLANDARKAVAEYPQKLKPENLNKILGLTPGDGISKINGIRMVVYQFDPAERTEHDHTSSEEKGAAFEDIVYTLPLPKLPSSIKPGMHYAVTEVLFDLKDARWHDLH